MKPEAPGHIGIRGVHISYRLRIPCESHPQRQVKILSDGWTAVTRDRSLSAQFEHSIGVTETGAEIFTLSPKGLDNPSGSPRTDA